MPWNREQWSAIAASYIRKYGREEGERRLHALKVKHGTRLLKDASKRPPSDQKRR
jgi:hypothetical protein